MTPEAETSLAKQQVKTVSLHKTTDDVISSATHKRRNPSPLLVGSRIIGDIMSPVVPKTDWEAFS